MKPVCHWCGGSFVRWKGSFWCTTEACRERQAQHSLVAQDRATGEQIYLYVPLPRQVEYDTSDVRFLLGGGAAGATKSHAARWGMYRRALRFDDYEGLLLRRTWGELEKHHLRLMEKDARLFQSVGIKATFSITNRELRFPNGSIIEGGHMENPDDVEKYLSREREEITCDEGSTFAPMPLLNLSTRARTTKPHIAKHGFRGLFRVFTNPGGPAAEMLRDFFIDHEPNWEDFPAELKRDYRPEEWRYIPGKLEDNPYLPEDYERDLALLTPWRYQQLRHNDWDIVAGQFFTEFKGTAPYVQDLGDPGSNVQWFRSMDWGYVNPGCVLWWACLPDGIYYVRYEMKFSHATIEEVATDIKNKTSDNGIYDIRYTAADPALWQPAGTTGEAMNETFVKHGVPLMKAHNDRPNGWQRIREMFRLREDGNPTIIIHPECRYLIRTIAAAISAKNDPEDVDTTLDDHAIDTLRYGAMSRPAPTKARTLTSGNTFVAAQARIRQYNRKMKAR